MFNFFKKSSPKEDFIPLEDYSAIGVDFHSHLIHSIDDGVQNMEEAITIVRNLKNMGYERIVTTPHIMTEAYNNNPTIIKNGLNLLREKIREQAIDIKIDAAAEYYIDDTFEQRMETEELLTFGDNYLLIEKSMFQETADFKDIVYKLLVKGYKVIVAHPERYKYMYEKNSIEQFEDMKNSGVWMQMNLFSLIGLYGRQSQEIAEKLIDAELIDFVSSDIHRPDQIEFLREALKKPYLKKLIDSGNLLNKKIFVNENH